MTTSHGEIPNTDFRKLSNQTAPALSNEALSQIAALMDQDDGANPLIPAGYTYLGQFIDHDITFTAPDGVNGRTPQLDLDSLYGKGPNSAEHGALYEQIAENAFIFKIGNITNRDADLLRNSAFVATIPDGRNDENILIASLHLAMQKFHNKLVLTENLSFENAKQTLIWHYQSIVMSDFLRRIVSASTFNKALLNPLAFAPTNIAETFIPMEFAGACYRFGHSMVREKYNFNARFRNENSNANLFFNFPGGRPLGNDAISAHQITPIWSIQGNGNSLAHFFDPNIINTGADNLSGNISIGLPPVLFNLQVANGSNILALRNLQSGQTQALPSAQQLIVELNEKGADIVPLTQEQLRSVGLPASALTHTPLWFYTLLEAEVQQGKQKLGQLGGLIVAETLLGILKASPNSVLNAGQDTDTWSFRIPQENPSGLQMIDVIRYIDNN